jgi:8-amino-7-oxononanoate synthase
MAFVALPERSASHGEDLFAKCDSFRTARDLIERGIYPFFHPSDPIDPTLVVIDGRPRIMLGSNNYLGLTHHPEVIRRTKQAIDRYGTGCTGSRLLNGTLTIHEQLEERLAEFLSKESALLFSTGYQTNVGVISSLIGASDLVVLDRLCHASLLDGAQLSSGKLMRFPHGDLAALERMLQTKASVGGTLCVTDGVFSMDGDLPDLPALTSLARRYGARVLVDDAHAVGVLGTRGRGSLEHFNLTDAVDLVMVTFSKSFGSIGGAIAGPREVIHYLRHHARPLIFSASLPPAAVAAVLACIDVMDAEPERRIQLWENAGYLRQGLHSLGFDTAPSASPVMPIVIGTIDETFSAWRALLDAGVFVNAVAPPAVNRNACRLRLSAMSTHTRDQLDTALDAFARLRRRQPRPARNGIHLRQLERGDSMKPFIEFAWTVNGGDPAWVPPLRSQLKATLDRSRHPFHRHGEVTYFVAERHGQVVGRVAAIVNPRHNNFHSDETGFFGFFDAVNDQDVVALLMEGAGTWLKSNRLTRMIGPANFSTNDECGLLVRGFDCPPAVMMPHNPPYYADLLEGVGLTKAKDLLAYRLLVSEGPPERLTSGLRRIGLDERSGFRIRPLQLARLDDEVALIRRLYHLAWRDNWGFVPMTEDEFDFMAHELRSVIDPDLCLIAEDADRGAVGFSIALPDVNQALKSLNGRLYPFGFLRFLLSKSKIDNLRILTLGVDPSFRRRGIDAALYLKTWQSGKTKGYRTAEASWILEDNWPMRRAIEHLGGECFKTYRLYRREL